MSKSDNQPSSQPVVKRQSDNSQRSRTHLSAISANSTSTSGISSNTSFALIEEAPELGTAHDSSSIEKVLPALPLAPGRGYRNAPPGQRFVCPLKECKGKWAYKRVGDYLNHMEKEHPEFPPHDASNYLRQDLRVSTTPIEAKGECMENFSETTAPDSPSGSYPEVHALSDASTHRSDQDAVVAGFDFVNFAADMPADFDDMALGSERCGSLLPRPLFGEVNGVSQYHLVPAQRQQSYFYHEDEMQTG